MFGFKCFARYLNLFLLWSWFAFVLFFFLHLLHCFNFYPSLFLSNFLPLISFTIALALYSNRERDRENVILPAAAKYMYINCCAFSIFCLLLINVETSEKDLKKNILVNCYPAIFYLSTLPSV